MRVVPLIFAVALFVFAQHPGMLISPAELAKVMNEPGVVILHVGSSYSVLRQSGRGRGGDSVAMRGLEIRSFGSLDEYSKATQQDRHSLTLDYDIFVNVPPLDAKDTKNVQRLYKAEDLDFRLKPASAAVDHGMVLPNITDGYTGQQPDLGALKWVSRAALRSPTLNFFRS